MALSRRTGARFQASIWPGFVDAMTGLLLVLMFVLTIFAVMQFVLQQTVKGQGVMLDELNVDIAQKNAQLEDLEGQILALGDALGLERAAVSDLTLQVAKLDDQLAAAQAQGERQLVLIATLTAERDARVADLKAATTRINDFETQVANLLALQQRAEAEIEGFKLQVSQLQTQQAQSEGTILDFEAQVASLLRDQTQSEGQITELEAQLTLLLAQSLQDTARITDAEVQISALQDEKSKAKAMIADFEIRLQQLIEIEAQRREELATLDEDKASLQQSLLAAQATIAAKTEQAALAERQRELMDEMLADLRRDAQNTNINLANTLALLATQQERASQLEQENQELSRRAEELVSALNDEELNRVSAAFLRERLEAVEAALSQSELEQLSMAAAAEKLRADLEQSEAAISSLTLELNDQRKKAEETLALLAAAQSAEKTLDDELVKALLALEAARLAEALSQEELAALSARDEANQQELQAALFRLESMTVALQAAEANAQNADTDDLRSALSKAIAARLSAERKLNSAEQKAALLAMAQAELQEAKAISTEAQRKMALLSQEVRELRAQISGLQATLGDYKRRDVDNNVKITNLGSELNVALAQVAAESKRNLALEAAEKQRLKEEKARLEAEAKTLERYRSEFFGSLRGLLEDIDGVSIVGDRFVFSSEVLFASGRAELTAAGRKEISKVANILKDVTEEIPQNIDWVLQVDGHTDDQPILPGSKFQNNWELSQARALSVVLYLMTSEQMPPRRLSANGFGEYQPINPANSRVARAQNRRIELKLTER
ncbi:peptidoglycan -binding protein [Planktomarina sp.]|uniref:peptidoglycan -binding protein n=1 Tax=Planktomarina sp. TaxID=2024851 RepID=UPI002891B2F4|nr:peptidoglycan -binding protein [Planktomarina sp.]MDT2069836.1 peptidoglycan -binding protein [Planktomarina sp.]